MLVDASNIAVSLDAMLSFQRGDSGFLKKEFARSLGCDVKDVVGFELTRKSVDARKKSNVHFCVNATIDIDSIKYSKKTGFKDLHPKKGVNVKEHKQEKVPCIKDISKAAAEVGATRPVIIGAGPAGLFSALHLAYAGLRPILVERGKPVDERISFVSEFFNTGRLDPDSNIQFGEGGAGTFSDGKLNTGIKSKHIRYVLEQFVDAGAPPDILIESKPHIGTDYLVDVVRNIREKIISLGGEVLFNTTFKALETDAEGKCVKGVVLESGDLPTSYTISTDTVVLAIGHSARDTLSDLFESGITMQRKPFAVGVRIEHPQSFIDSIQYGSSAGHPALPPADYKLAVKTKGGRGVYTFCMCPGGEVVAASSEAGLLCINGMSNSKRDGVNANSALLVEVRPDDFDGDDVLAGIGFQRDLERCAYKAASDTGAKPYTAPAERLGSFLGRGDRKDASPMTNGEFPPPEPTYPLGVVEVALCDILPEFVSSSLKEALPKFDSKMPGFASDDAILTAVEARSSSPVRIVRDRRTLQSISVDGLYPCGEGAGYAGGITSAAVDGIRVAERVEEEIEARGRIAQATERLCQGDPVIFPTDTVYGIGVSVAHASSPKRLYEIKERPDDKPVAWLVGDISDLEKYGDDVADYALEIAREKWPGAITLIVKASSEVPRGFVSKEGTIALRMPNSKIALDLIKHLKSPIATTSANISGHPSALSFSELEDLLVKEVFAIEGDDELKEKVPSAIIDCTGAHPVSIR